MSPREQALLLELACAAIRRAAAGKPPPPLRSDLPPALARPGAVFVTLTRVGALRGCIGGLEARFPLAEATRQAAVDAALRDPRFAPVEAGELQFLQVEVSVLSALEEIVFASEEQLLAQLARGVHGLLIEKNACRATFLPAVWHSVPAPTVFLALLKQKAGLSPHTLLAGGRAWRYTADVIGPGVAAATGTGARPVRAAL